MFKIALLVLSVPRDMGNQGIILDQHSNLPDIGMIAQHCFNLAKFYPVAAQFDLAIQTPEVVIGTARQAAHKVASLVEPAGAMAVRSIIMKALLVRSSACR